MSEVAKNINTDWLKAGIIGSTWAAFEIIAGSFLHNLRVPFAGTMLSAASVFLLISFMQVWKERGVVLKAGIICALMKSISPSAIIIGPMVGIFMEAFIIEIAVFILGRNLMGYLISGALAVLWSLTQKILFLLLMYGLDLIELAESLYQYLIKISGISMFASVYLIVGVALMYMLVGALAGYSGYLSGKRYVSSVKNIDSHISKQSSQANRLQVDPNQPFSLVLLFVVLAVIVLNLYFVNAQLYWQAGGLGLLFIGFCIYRYRHSTKYLQKPTIWIQFLVITLVAAFLWEWAATGNYFSLKGLAVGLEMNYRAIIIIFGFAAVGVELRNPAIKNLLSRKGFYNLHQTLSFSFATLPAIIDSLPKPVNLFKKRKLIVNQVLSQSQNLFESIEKQRK